MAELTDKEIDAAAERGRIAHVSEPRASAARYDSKLGQVIVDLTNGCTFTFPPRLVQGLEAATDNQLGRMEILGAGYGLHWDEPEVDVSVEGLRAGVFGTRAYMARRAGGRLRRRRRLPLAQMAQKADARARQRAGERSDAGGG